MVREEEKNRRCAGVDIVGVLIVLLTGYRSVARTCATYL